MNESMTKTLFMLHPKFHKWLPPGGHMEPNETPEEAARREIAEETGVLDVNFIAKRFNEEFTDSRTEMLLKPHFIMSQLIEQNHYHLDMIFFAKVQEKEYVSPEKHNLKWFSVDDVKNEKEIFENVKKLALYGFQGLT